MTTALPRFLPGSAAFVRLRRPAALKQRATWVERSFAGEDLAKPKSLRGRTDARSPNLHSARQPSYPTSRAFFHWRLSDDGPVQAASSRVAVIRNPSQE
jgi:hypothetical protein